MKIKGFIPNWKSKNMFIYYFISRKYVHEKKIESNEIIIIANNENV